MVRQAVFTRMLMLALVVPLLSVVCVAIGNGVEDEVGSSKGVNTNIAPRLEFDRIGRGETEWYTKHLNSRLRDWNLGSAPFAVPAHQSDSFVSSRVPAVHHELLAQRNKQGLLYLTDSIEGRRIYAVFLDHVPRGVPNTAIISAPKKWNALEQSLKLHSFAHVEKADSAQFHRGMQSDVMGFQLDSLMKSMLPKTPQSEFDSLFPRFPTPHFR